MHALSVDDLQYFETRFFLVPGTGTVYIDAKLSVIRRRAVGRGFHEELTILNHAGEPVDLSVRFDAGCDFADLFEVKDALEKKGAYSARGRARKAGSDLRARNLRPRDRISASERARIDENGLTFTIRIGAHDRWSTPVDVVAEIPGIGAAGLYPWTRSADSCGCGGISSAGSTRHLGWSATRSR